MFSFGIFLMLVDDTFNKFAGRLASGVYFSTKEVVTMFSRSDCHAPSAKNESSPNVLDAANPEPSASLIVDKSELGIEDSTTHFCNKNPLVIVVFMLHIGCVMVAGNAVNTPDAFCAQNVYLI